MTNKELKRLDYRITKAQNKEDWMFLMLLVTTWNVGGCVSMDDYRHLLELANKYHVRVKKQEVGLGI